MPATAAVQRPRAEGAVRLASKARSGGDGSTLADLRQQGSLKALFPRGDGPGLVAMLLNTAGGVTGGDRMAVTAEAQAGSRLVLTTQAAERLYAALPDETGQVVNRLAVGPGARLDWLPQETILFDRARVRRSLTVEMAPDARFVMVEPLILGRPAMGETVRQASFSDRIRIHRDGALLFADRLALDGDLAARFARPGVAAGGGAVATLLVAASGAEDLLNPLRRLLDDTPGASAGAAAPAEGLLVARFVADDAFTLRRALIPALTHLHGHPLPRSWML